VVGSTGRQFGHFLVHFGWKFTKIHIITDMDAKTFETSKSLKGVKGESTWGMEDVKRDMRGTFTLVHVEHQVRLKYCATSLGQTTA
jgi:hypothetical protein